MRLRLLLFTCFQWALWLAAQAQQPIVTGRIVRRTSNEPLPGVTIVERGTTNGCATGADGRFGLPVVHLADSVLLTVASVGFTTRIVRVAPGCHAEIALDSSRELYDTRRRLGFTVGLLSGLRYTPFGGSLQLLGLRFVTPSLAYQTNLHRTHAAHARLASGPWILRRCTVSGSLDWQDVRLPSADWQFTSHTATLGLRKYRIGPWLAPELLLTAGYARRRTLSADRPTRMGAGCGAGLRHEFLPYPFRLLAEIHVTRWPGYWQGQGQLLHLFSDYRYRAGVTTHWLPHYRAVSVVFSYTLDRSPATYVN